MKNTRPTMQDVARRAGVTQPTVSYVINETANISEEVKARVNQAIKELHYKPNYFARALKTNKSGSIGIIIPDISNEYYSKMTYIAERLLNKKGFMITILSTNYSPKKEEKAIRQLLNHNVEGIVVMYQLVNPLCWDMLDESDKGVAVIEGGANTGKSPSINTDNFWGGYAATKHLIERGRRKIGYVGQNVNIEALSDRKKGYKKAMEESGYEFTFFDTVEPADMWDEGRKLGDKILKSHVDGLIVSSDIIAVGIMKVLSNAGKRVPEDISIIGYDDIPLARLFLPALTTVAQPMDEMCKMAVDILTENVKIEDEAISHICPKIMIRETT